MRYYLSFEQTIALLCFQYSFVASFPLSATKSSAFCWGRKSHPYHVSKNGDLWWPPKPATDAAAGSSPPSTMAAGPSRRSRRQVLVDHMHALLTTGILLAQSSTPARALVKGNAPPPKTKADAIKKCTNIADCQAQAEVVAEQQRKEALASLSPPEKTASGIKYRDIRVGNGEKAKEGQEVTLYYKVLKLGKRSYDGLSGEGTVVFSRGYGLEDDEPNEGSQGFITTLGAPYNIRAVNDAVPGMQVGGVRRAAVYPDFGWRKPGQACDGGPGGRGQGGDLRTDYVVVPTATMVAEEACFDSTKQPFPRTYAQQRRMAQRFDQLLILEVKLVDVGSKGLL